MVSCSLFPWRRSGHRLPAAPEDLDDAHLPAAAGTRFAQGERNDLSLGCGIISLFGARFPEQGPDLRDIDLAVRAGRQTAVADAVEAVGQDVDAEAAGELGGGQPHDLHAIARLDPAVLPAERDGVGIGADQTAVRDRDPLSWFAWQTTAGQWAGVSAEIGQHRLGPAEGRLGINHPFGFARRREICGKGLRIRQSTQVAEEGEAPGAMRRHQPFEEQAPEQPRQNPHMQEEPRPAGDPPGAVGRRAAVPLPGRRLRSNLPRGGTIMWMWG